MLPHYLRGVHRIGERDHVHATAFVEIAGVNIAEGLFLFQKSLYGSF